MGIHKISIKNFRVFKEKTAFLLRPLTILTGPNNSGKSSFIKFLLLIREGISELNFTKGNHNLENFENSLNWNSNKKSLEFEVSLKNKAKLIYSYKSKILSQIKYLENDKTILDFSGRAASLNDNEEVPFNITNFKLLFCYKIDIDYLIEKKLKKDFGNVLFHLFDDKETYDSKVWEEGLFFKIFINKKEQTLEYKKVVREIQRDLFNGENQLSVIDPINSSVYELISNELNYLLNDLKEGFCDALIEHTGISEDDLKIEISEFGKNFLFANIFQSYDKKDRNFFISTLLNLINEDQVTQKLFYLSPERGNQKRVLMNQSEKDIDSIIVEFSKKQNIHKNFLTKCLEILEIEGELEINRYENTISTIYLVKEDKKIALADLGFGYSQIIPIILKVHNLLPDIDVNVLKEQRRTQNYLKDDFGFLLLEEPEANLHPNLQSRLAELLVFIRSFINIKFIIETHSEYFIRKLQYLTAKNELKTKDSVIYYFNDDKYISSSEPKVKEIFINEYGGLSDSFGPGFFDEATKLQFDLMKLNKEQLN